MRKFIRAAVTAVSAAVVASATHPARASNFHATSLGATVYCKGNADSNVSLLEWGGLQAQLDASGTVTLMNDVTAESGDTSLTVTGDVTLDLNGYTLTHNGSNSVIKVASGGHLTLTNSLGVGAVTGGSAERGGGVYVESNAVFRLQGGTIADNTGGIDGGGVYVAGGGTFTMTGGTIIGNAAPYAGGVEVFGTFTMTGGTISGNAVDTISSNAVDNVVGGVRGVGGAVRLRHGERIRNGVPARRRAGGGHERHHAAEDRRDWHDEHPLQRKRRLWTCCFEAGLQRGVPAMSTDRAGERRDGALAV